MNLLENLSPENFAASGLTWYNPPIAWSPLAEGGIRVQVQKGANYFRDPAGAYAKDTAPLLYRPVTGDFVARAHVRPEFNTVFDAAALMMRHSETVWIKMCFERTDFGSTAAVSVVTNGVSDDANGVDVTQPDLWLQMYRVGHVFGLHYALDGVNWRMVRLFSLEVPETVPVGVVTQCPVGPGTYIDVLHFSIEARTVQNLRAGV